MVLNWSPCAVGEIDVGEVNEGKNGRTIVWEPTARCNYNCEHCYYKNEVGVREEKLTTQEIVPVLREAYSLGFTNLELLGGEPTLRNDIYQIFKKAKEIGFENFQIITNGSLINRKVAEKLAKLEVVTIISIDGPKEINDKIRGKGSFEKSLNAVKKLSKENVEVDTYTVVTRDVTGISKNRLKRFLQKLAEVGLSCANFGKLTIEHLEDIKSIKPDKDEFLEFNKFLLNNKEKWENELGIKIFIDDGLTFPVYWNQLKDIKKFPEKYSRFFRGKDIDQGVIGCTAGRKNIIIDPEGNVLDCVFLRRKFGNIRKESFKKTLKRVMKKYTSPYPQCKGCKLEGICGGSCRLLGLNEKLKKENSEIKEEEIEEYIYKLTSC